MTRIAYSLAAVLSALALALVLVGCGSDPPSFVGQPDTDTDTDTDSDSDSDSDTDSDSDSDSDSDTDTDTDSDCEGNGHDEDGDGLDDNCDNCPTYQNSEQADGDEDGVGDACEANWNADLLSEILVFDPIIDTQAEWAPDDGSWSYDTDEVTGTAHPNGGNYYRSPFLEDDVYSVEATFRFGPSGATGESFAGIVFAVHEDSDWYGTFTAFFTCLYQRGSHVLSAWQYSGGQYVEFVDNVEDIDDPATANQWHKVRAFYNGEGAVCTYEDEAGGYAELGLDSGEIWPVMAGNGGLRVYNESAVYTSFAIYL
jgi:hypothetical protein